ncbi:uncharacterized protein LOC143869730 [Tasmannia lanceolata]|uniref:uncharacterized protein LOC143869730 n=1 Tax=Tasmannia lanceolata TaxID=3420 RepID=UPI004063F083
MAKNKVAKVASTNQEKAQKTTTQEDQLVNLKTLNNLLIKETVEKREQVDSLIRSKEMIEMEFARSFAENQRLKDENSLYKDQILTAEIERSIGVTLVSSQMAEALAMGEAEAKLALAQKLKMAEAMGDLLKRDNEEVKRQVLVFETAMKENIREKEEMERDRGEKKIQIRVFREERDRVLREMDGVLKEADGLRLRVLELEKINVGIQEEKKLLAMEKDGLVEEKGEMERSFNLLMDEKSLLHTNLEESLHQFEVLKREMEVTVREKNEIEQTRIEQDFVITELRKEVGLLRSEISHDKDAFDCVLRERDAVQKDLDVQKEETEELKLEVFELEKSNALIKEEVQRLEMERDRLVVVTKERERNMESLMAEKISIQRNVVELSHLIEGLKIKINETVGDAEKIEQARAAQELKINELNVVLSHHKDSLDRALCERDAAEANINLLKEEKEGLQSKVFELEKSNDEVQVELSRILMEFNGVVEEKKEKERNLETLVEEKIIMQKSLVESSERFKDLMRKMDEIIREKDGIEQVRIKEKSQISELQTEVSQLNTTISVLHDSCRNHKEANDLLKADIRRHKDAFDMLMEEKTLIQRNLGETQKSFVDLQMKLKGAENCSERAISMLKNTVKRMNESEDEEKDGKGVGIEGGEMEEEIMIQPFVAELEGIKRAFKSRVLKVQEVSQKLEILQTSAAEAQKKRNWWALLSSATTVLAAASVAYVARGR